SAVRLRAVSVMDAWELPLNVAMSVALRWHLWDWQRHIGCHLPPGWCAYPGDDHQEWFGHRCLPSIGDGDVERRIGLGDIGGQRDGLYPGEIGRHHEGALIEVLKVLHHDVCAPEPGPIAFGGSRCLGDKQG